ncbi:tyrosine-type recombinase/integrase [Demequina gelatinilytica]|uniref:tyrosine-type recombinase/integrase n=1 Tax=Demequina gelatinilytica TaxID=1638980 RepID=UPI0012E05DC4|nr:tyrosine-type recombinase/integrase [Demequina gelatinilytica]
MVDDEYEIIDIAHDWLQFIRLKGDSLNTVRKYSADLAYFLTWAKAAGQTVSDAPRVMTGFVSLLSTDPIPEGRRNAGRPRSPARCNDMLVAVRSFYRWALAHNRVPADLETVLWETATRRGRPVSIGAHRFREIRTVTKPTLDEDEMNRLMAVASRNPRDLFILSLLRFTGMRSGQILGLRLEDLHLRDDNRRFDDPSGASGGCRVRGPHIHRVRREDNPNGALNKARHIDDVAANEALVAACFDYLPWRNALPGAANTTMLILNKQGRALGRRYPGRMLERLSKTAGIEHVGPHMFRHTVATTLLRKGERRDTVQRVLGQTHPNSLDPYTHVSDQEQRDAVDRLDAPWMEGL